MSIKALPIMVHGISLDNVYKNNHHNKSVTAKTPEKQVHDYDNNRIDLDNYLVGDIKTVPDDIDNLQDKIHKTVFEGLMATEIGVGRYQIAQSHLNPVDMIKKTHNNSANVMHKIGNTQDFKNLYHNGLKFAGIASIFSGLASLVRCTTGIADIYYDVQYHKENKNLHKQKQEKIHDLQGIISDTTLSKDDLKHLKQEKIHDLEKIIHQEKDNKRKIDAKKMMMRDIHSGTDFLAATGSLIGVKGMLGALTNPQAISQAVSAFGGGAVASAQTVTAIQMGIGLLIAGVTVSSVATMIKSANHFLKRPNDKNTDDTPKDTSQHSDAISGATQLMTGVGNLVLLNNKSGFPIYELLNHGEAFMNLHHESKVMQSLTGISTGFMMLGGTQSLVNAFLKPKNKS